MILKSCMVVCCQGFISSRILMVVPCLLNVTDNGISESESGSIAVSRSLNIDSFLFVMAGLTLAPLVVKVEPNLNVILTACLAVFVGCYRSVKPTPPTVSSGFHAHSSLYVGPFTPQHLICLNHVVYEYAGDNVQ